MRKDIIKYLFKEVEYRCQLPTNFFGIGCFFHIIASITDYNLYEDHHTHGAEIAKKILQGFKYDPDKIKLVQKCIRNHRGSVLNSKVTLEKLCVADADSISHFDNVPSFLYLAYVNRKVGIDEGREFVNNKLKRSFEKLSIRSKLLYKIKFEQVMSVLK